MEIETQTEGKCAHKNKERMKENVKGEVLRAHFRENGIR